VARYNRDHLSVGERSHKLINSMDCSKSVMICPLNEFTFNQHAFNLIKPNNEVFYFGKNKDKFGMNSFALSKWSFTRVVAFNFN
jgi:hypothetical protein